MILVPALPQTPSTPLEAQTGPTSTVPNATRFLPVPGPPWHPCTSAGSSLGPSALEVWSTPSEGVTPPRGTALLRRKSVSWHESTMGLLIQVRLTYYSSLFYLSLLYPMPCIFLLSSYIPSLDQWTMVAPLLSARSGPGTTVMDGCIYIAGDVSVCPTACSIRSTLSTNA